MPNRRWLTKPGIQLATVHVYYYGSNIVDLSPNVTQIRDIRWAYGPGEQVAKHFGIQASWVMNLLIMIVYVRIGLQFIWVR